MTPEERSDRTERLQAARVAAGKSPTIDDPVVYRLLEAVFASKVADTGDPLNTDRE